MKKSSKGKTTASSNKTDISKKKPKAQNPSSSRWVKRAYNMLEYYDHRVYRAFLFAFIRTGILSFITYLIFKSINRSNEFFAIFVPVLLFFVSSVHRYCYLPAMESPFIYNMAFFYSGVTMVLFNVFTRNAGIGMLSTPEIPGSVIVIGPCIVIFLLIYLFGMKADIFIMKMIREKLYKLFHRNDAQNDNKKKVSSKANNKKAKEGKKAAGKAAKGA